MLMRRKHYTVSLYVNEAKPSYSSFGTPIKLNHAIKLTNKPYGWI